MTTSNTSKGKYKRDQYRIRYPYLFPEGKMIPGRIPTVNIPGVISLASAGQYPASSAGPIYGISDNFTWVRGDHTLKTGLPFERAGENDNDQPGNQQNGTFSFLHTRPGGTGLALANAALGLFSTYAEGGVRSYTPCRSQMMEWFAQDSWKVTPKLRLEMGLPHSLIQPYYSLWRNMWVFDARVYDSRIAVTQDPRTGFIISGDLKSRYNGLVLPGDGWPASAQGRFPIADSGEYDFLFRGIPKEYSPTHKRDLQPRLGIAYAVTPNMAVRSGVGRFFQRLGVSDNTFLGANPPLQPASTISNGSVDQPGGGTSLALPLSVTTQDRDYRNPESWVWNVSVERQLPWRTTLAAAYIGRRGLHSPIALNLNQLPTGTLTANPGINADYLRPYKGYGSIQFGTNAGSSRYNGLQLEASRRFSGSFGFGVSYTY